MAFDFCRECNRPVTVRMIEPAPNPGRFQLFPSGWLDILPDVRTRIARRTMELRRRMRLPLRVALVIARGDECKNSASGSACGARKLSTRWARLRTRGK